jgi:hypothetical protein
LSGLAKNKQHPLTGGSGGFLPAYNVGNIEREVFFDFKAGQLYDPDTLSALTSSSVIATYSQEKAVCNPLVYLELKSLLTPSPKFPFPVKGSKGTKGVSPYNKGNFQTTFNKNSFQLLAPGIDEKFTDGNETSPIIANCDRSERDNITNFSEGRLEKTILQ